VTPVLPRNLSPIALLTDFGYRDHYAGVMKGVIASIVPQAPLIDLTHGIPPQNIIAGAIALRQSWRCFPPRTIFLAVVDPGVGTARLPIAIETRPGARFIGPDNGLLSLAAADAGVRTIVELRSPRYRLQNVSATFHGRDVFAPAAAWLWRGLRIAALGPKLDQMVSLDAFPIVEEGTHELRGAVIYVDAFGNLVTNISRAQLERFAARFRGSRLWVRIKRYGGVEIRKAYGDVPPGAPLATLGSFDTLEIAVRDGSAAGYFAAESGTLVSIRTDS
jgi:S-adenosyl-L-methionine hydrolase (adenosine-forming)